MTIITEGWEDKTILDAEKSAVNIIKRTTYSGQNIPIRWKAVSPGSIKLVFVLMTYVGLGTEKLHKVCQESGVTKMCIDDCVFYNLQVSITIL